MRDKHDFDAQYIIKRGKFISKILTRVKTHLTSHQSLALKDLTFTYARAAAQYGGIKDILSELEIIGEIKIENERRLSQYGKATYHKVIKLIEYEEEYIIA